MAPEQSVRVLSVGQCRPDGSAISSLIEGAFPVVVHEVADVAGALEALTQQPFVLVLVNRILDQTLEEGAELITRMKQDERLRQVPVMLVSNFEAAQQDAAALGAVPGFGKADLDAPATLDLLKPYLTAAGGR